MPDVESAEAVFCKIVCDGSSIITGCVYRSPSSGEDSISFVHEFLSQHARRSRVIIMGDFNLADFNWASMHHTSPSSKALVNLMLDFNLHQVVSDATRIQGTTGNILDLILLSDHFPNEKIEISIADGISDHKMPVCRLTLDCKMTVRPTAVTFINYQKANNDSIQTYLAHEFQPFFETASDVSANVNLLWLQFKVIVLHCINNFIPVKHKKQPRKPMDKSRSYPSQASSKKVTAGGEDQPRQLAS